MPSANSTIAPPPSAGPTRSFALDHTLAFALCLGAAMLLLWPLLTGQMLFGGSRSDMFIAGYSFRLFGAESFLKDGAIPQWNPYLFGGLPYIAAMHGDIFYPTAWLRWIMPVDVAITLGMAIHFVLTGWFTYRFCRSLGLSWNASVIAGVAYELTGIVASQMSPGHDGKLFVAAIAPLAFWTLLGAIRHGKTWCYGAFAFVVALMVLGHYHPAYFLLIALGIWALYLVFFDPERPANVNPVKALGFSLLAVVVGCGITALQVLPFLEYVPFSPRAEGGPDTGWQFATSYALPPSEIFTLLLPQFNGVLDQYWGRNAIKFHTEYMGFLPLALAALALGDKARRRLVIVLGASAVFFLLFAFAGYTPFYKPFYELLPLVKKIRAMGMVFYLPAFLVCVLAGIGVDRLLTRAVPMRTVLIVVGGAAAFALLGAAGGLQGLAESLAIPERLEGVAANAPYLQSGALRLLVFVVLGGVVLWATAAGRVTPRLATAALVVLVGIDLWSVDRQFFTFSPRASEQFADDAVTTYLKKVPPPYRVIDGGASYQQSILMAYRIPSAMGYHGFQLQRYNELAGAQQGYRNLLTPNMFDLLSVRYIILPDTQPVPGFHQVVPVSPTAFGTTATLYESDVTPAYARVMPVSAKLSEEQGLATIIDPRFPVNNVALLPDTSTATSPNATPPFPTPQVKATVTEWSAGAMRIALAGAETATSQLVVSENWYPDWHAEVDGKPGVVRRADHTLISVDIPPGAKEVRLWFDSPTYARGKMISVVSLLLAAAMMFVPMFLAVGTKKTA